jgi:hypothetical protein
MLAVLLEEADGNAAGIALPRALGQKARYGDERGDERQYSRAESSRGASKAMPKGRNFQ